MDIIRRKSGQKSTKKPGNPAPVQPKIGIVGAGCSGIAAASSLFKKGYRNIVILEARNRIGGRTFTDRRWGAHEPIDHGKFDD